VSQYRFPLAPETPQPVRLNLTTMKVRIFTIGVGSGLNPNFLRGLAESHLGKWSVISEEGDIEQKLCELFEEFTRPLFIPGDLSFGSVETDGRYPDDTAVLVQGDELFQVGRYRGGGGFTLTLEGYIGDQQLSFDYPLNFTPTDTSQSLIPRLWAHQKVAELENRISRYGERSLNAQVLDLGLTYRLVTSRTSLFAPDDEVIVDPDPVFAEDDSDLSVAIAVEEEALYTSSWLGKTFYLRDGIWVDIAFRPNMETERYRPDSGQPVELISFHALKRDLLVVVEDRAYQIERGILPDGPNLQQNWPNPFNAMTLIHYRVPAAMGDIQGRLVVYNLSGQRIRLLAAGEWTAGEYRVTWDGRDDEGREAASGAYIYRLETVGYTTARRMLLLH
jgi:hypothetical protein